MSWALKETFKLRKVERLLTYTVLGKVLSQGVLNYLFIKYLNPTLSSQIRPLLYLISPLSGEESK